MNSVERGTKMKSKGWNFELNWQDEMKSKMRWNLKVGTLNWTDKITLNIWIFKCYFEYLNIWTGLTRLLWIFEQLSIAGKIEVAFKVHTPILIPGISVKIILLFNLGFLLALGSKVLQQTQTVPKSSMFLNWDLLWFWNNIQSKILSTFPTLCFKNWVWWVGQAVVEIHRNLVNASVFFP